MAVAFGFNSWGDRFTPTLGDLSVRPALAATLEVPFEDATGDAILEGGAFSSNGAGTFLVSAECVLTPSRNPRLSREEFRQSMARRLGTETVIWVPYGLMEDLVNTDGHVDNVAVFASASTVVAQTVESGGSNHSRLAANIALLEVTTIDSLPLRVVHCPYLAYATLPDGRRAPAPYINFALTNRSVLLPTVGAKELDKRAKALFEGLFPERRVRFAPSTALAYGGGGPHCVTMHVPAAGG